MKTLINKIGLDKIAHWGVGGVICAFVAFILILQDFHICSYKSILLYPFVGYIVTLFFAVIKEFFIDGNNASWKDIIASILGCVFIHLAICIGILFNYLTMQI